MTFVPILRGLGLAVCLLGVPVAAGAAAGTPAPSLQGPVAAKIRAPRRIAATTGGQFVVADAQGGLHLLTRRGDLVAKVLDGVRAVTSGGGKVYAVTQDARLLTLDDRDLKVVASVALAVGEAPAGIALDGRGGLLWMVYRSGVVEARRADGSVVAKTSLSGRLVDVALDGDAGIVWVAKDRPDAGGELFGLDASTGQLVRTVGDQSGPVTLSGALAVGKGGSVYLSDFFAGSIVLLSSAGEVLQTIGAASEVGPLTQPAGIGFMANGDLLVSNLYSGRLVRFGDGSPLPTCEGDSDCDGMADAWETANGLNPGVAGDALSDADGDGLSNLREYAIGTNPRNADTDGDGHSDAAELVGGFNPTDPRDHRTAVLAGVGGEYAPGIVPLSASVKTADESACSARWTQTAGEKVVLRGADGLSPTFVARKAGTYAFSVVAICGGVASEPATVTASVRNVAPLTDAQRVVVVDAGRAVRLDATRSSDANDDALSFDWMQLSGAAVSGGGADGALAVQAGLPGAYRFKVSVADASGALGEAVSDLVVLGAQPVPAVSAAPVVGAVVGENVRLDANFSNARADATVSWQQVAGVGVALKAANEAVAGFSPTAPGRYAFQVTVTSDGVSSPPATVEVFVGEAGQALPVAVATAPAVAAVGTAIELDGSGSSSGSGAVLEYAWRQVSGPAAGLGNAATAVGTAYLFAPGAYEFELTVADGAVVGVPKRVRVEARRDGKPIPVARVKAPARAHVGERVVMDASKSKGSRAFRWTQVAGPWVSLEGGAIESFRPQAAGVYVFELEVDDGQVRSAPTRVSVIVDEGMEG